MDYTREVLGACVEQSWGIHSVLRDKLQGSWGYGLAVGLVAMFPWYYQRQLTEGSSTLSLAMFTLTTRKRAWGGVGVAMLLLP